MVQDLTITICARSGSQRLVNKNMLKINGMTLIELSIIQALEMVSSENIIFSSDSQKYLDIATQYSIKLHRRESSMATNESGKIDVLKKLSDLANTEFMIDLDPTAPIRERSDLCGIYDLLLGGKEVALGVCRMESINPYFNMIEVKNGNRISTVANGTYLRSQDSPIVYLITGTVGWNKEYLLHNSNFYESDKWGLHEMEEHKMFDIDTKTDYLIVKALMEESI